MPTSDAHVWRFFRIGGFDQPLIESGADLMTLDELDQKLWVALACPTRGLEFDPRTLDLIDTDRNGRIHAPEIIAAAKWAGGLLKDPDELVRGGDGLPLAAIDDSSDEGARILASARQILRNLGKADAGQITVADSSDVAGIFKDTVLNGDGVVPAGAAADPEVARVIGEIVTCLGAVPDRGGAPGVDKAHVDRFFEAVAAHVAWAAEGDFDPAIRPIGDGTAAAAAAVAAVRAKVDDYFARVRLAAYDPRAAQPLNRGEADFAAIAEKDLSTATGDIEAFPLARVDPGRPLPLEDGLNPAWAGRIRALREAAARPLLGTSGDLTQAAWEALKAKLAPHDAWMARKAGGEVEQLGLDRLREIVAGNAKAAIEALLADDEALRPEADGIAAVDRLVRLKRDLYTLVNNFVAFRDFYRRGGKAIFQAGTLFLDGRSYDLCVRVDDAAKHAQLATASRIYLAYCDCQHQSTGEKMTIAAAVTNGDSDYLTVGRNGLFYDRKGRDWNATIVRLVDQPISIRQAFWAPYKRAAQMISDQVEKLAAARSKAVEGELATAGTAAATAPPAAGAKPPAQQQAFDVARFAGIFAAIGLALGAVGTAIAALVTGFFALTWWKMPLAVAGVILVISGPSMLVAALKLRHRNLAPMLDANGWAINARARINIPFGAALTKLPRLPKGAKRETSDPYADRHVPWRLYLALVVIALVLLILWGAGYRPVH